MNENWCKNQSYFSKFVLPVDCFLRYQSDTSHRECKISINLKVSDKVRQQKDTNHRFRLALYDEAICLNKNVMCP